MPSVTRSGVRICYDDEGLGPAVVLHTGGGGDARMWRDGGYVAALHGYRTLLIDHRGHGRSDWPAGVDAHRLDDYVQDAIAVLDDAGVESAAIVGYSFGARVAYALAARHADRVSAVVGIGALDAPDDDPAENAESAAEVRSVSMRAAMTQLADEEAQRPPAWLVENLASTDTEMFALLLEGLVTAPPVWTELSSVTAPTLFLVGAVETPTATEHAQLAASTVVNGRCVMLPDLAHLQMFWRTDLTIPPMVAFLHEHQPPVEADDVAGWRQT